MMTGYLFYSDSILTEYPPHLPVAPSSPGSASWAEVPDSGTTALIGPRLVPMHSPHGGWTALRVGCRQCMRVKCGSLCSIPGMLWIKWPRKSRHHHDNTHRDGCPPCGKKTTTKASCLRMEIHIPRWGLAAVRAANTVPLCRSRLLVASVQSAQSDSSESAGMGNNELLPPWAGSEEDVSAGSRAGHAAAGYTSLLPMMPIVVALQHRAH